MLSVIGEGLADITRERAEDFWKGAQSNYPSEAGFCHLRDDVQRSERDPLQGCNVGVS